MNVSSLTFLSGISGSTALSLLQSTTTASTSTTTDTSASRSASAPPPPPPPSSSGGADAQSLFEALTENDDADGDGLLSQAEIDESPVSDLLSQLFSALDADGDGALNEAELAVLDAPAGSGAAGVASARDMPPPPPPPPAEEDDASTDSVTGDSTTTAQSLSESIIQALSAEDDGTGTVTIDRKLANQFLSLLQEIA